MSRKIHSADELLRRYAEERSLLSGAKAQNLIAHSGGICALYCVNKHCAGGPTKSLAENGLYVLRCSVCQKPWKLDEKDLGRREFQDTRRGIVSIGEQRIRLGDFAVILKHVQERLPWQCTAWYVHVLAPTYEASEAGPATGLGVSLDLVPDRLQKLERAGEIDPMPFGLLTYYRVKTWIQAARNETMRRVLRAGLAV